MNTTFTLMLGLCLLAACAAGGITAIVFTVQKPPKKKKHSFKLPGKVDLKEFDNFNEEILYDKDMRESIDGANASKEFKKG